METLKMTQALDEKGFLRNRIITQISNLTVIGVRRKCDVNELLTEEFNDTAKAKYQSIVDQIDRYNRLSRAIIKANAEAIIEVNGMEMTRAEAISLRTSLKKDDNLEQKLLRFLRSAQREAQIKMDDFQSDLNGLKERYTTGMIASSATKEKSLTQEDIDAINKLTENYIPEIIDPINIEEKISSYGEKYDNLLQNLETAIKLSNATTDVTF